jgi:hypothetical protein
VKKYFENDIVSLVKIQIRFFCGNKNQENFVKRLEQILSRLVRNFFDNDIVSLVKIQIYSNLRNGSHLYEVTRHKGNSDI